METWRIIATSLFALGGLVLVLVAMAQVRDRKRSQRVEVVRAGLIGLVAVVVVTACIALWLPSVVAWGLVAATAMAVLFITMVD
ncbi:hypothetical protein SAMN05216188_102784 [Lentzea xinjiangensis]|uniref:Uncharacterized protein n=1 Tax=Lentzea xinjiangensis TaxID=402600 RepID=A0A1H9F697_9PSEU|nr:hypothetical protein [Lentzea xinjiangensis]SEQ32943.1 hypothetical protein SAMN05216188_102784 [Lentzea xinjiangensis]